MSYRGYLPFMVNLCTKRYIKTKEPISILEIGIQHGVTTLSLATHLSIRGVDYQFDAVDIKLFDYVPLLADSLLIGTRERLNLIEQNSLVYLDQLRNKKFDLVLVDGDHNYYTVSQECELLKKFTDENTVFIFDDYDGKWSHKDLFYKRDRKGYEDVKLATEPPVGEQNKQGVKSAVDEFIEESGMQKVKLMQGSPIVVASSHIISGGF